MQHICEFGKQVRLPFKKESVSDVNMGPATASKQTEMKATKEQEKQG